MRTRDADILIIGTGAGGGVLAGTLTELLPGKRIILAEKGGHYGPEFFNQREWDTRVAYADKNRRSTADGAIAVKSGEAVGGGTILTAGMCHDPIESVWTRWRDQYGVRGLSFDRRTSDYGVPDLNVPACVEELKPRLNVLLTPESDVNENNLLFEKACAAIGISCERWERNVRDCVGCGFCTEGCAYGAKMATDATYVADAVGRGAELIHSFEIHAITIEKRNGALTATGAKGRVRHPDPGSKPGIEPGLLEIRARLVILAAGAIGDPVLLLRSGVPDPHHVIGRGLILHPSMPVAGVMDRDIENYHGVPGVSFSTHYNDSHGFNLECLFGHPMYGSSVFPFTGRDHFDLMKKFHRFAAFGVMLVDSVDLRNRVEVTPAQVRIHYKLGDSDRERLRFAAQRAVELMFAAGAREVVLPSDEPAGPLPVSRFTRIEEAKYAREIAFIPHRTTLHSAHCQATVKMSEEPRLGAINSRCESHDVRNLVVCDGASFPTSCYANPMFAIMALARYQGRRIAAEWDRYAS